MRTWKFLVLGAALLYAASQAEALIMAKYDLKQMLADSEFVVVAKVDQLFAEKPAMILTVQEDLKGKAPFRRLPTNLKGDSVAADLKHVPILLDRLAADLPVVLFVTKNDPNKKNYISFVYTNGTWFHLVGQKTGEDSVVWSLAHGEPYLRKTFKGTTAEMKQVVADVLAGKKKAPAYNVDEAAGFGPEVKK